MLNKRLKVIKNYTGEQMAFLIDDLFDSIYTNWNKSEEIELQRKTNYKNLQLQQRALDYQKSLQQQIFQREDTAHQREINDLKEAGINPLSTALGGSGANTGAVVNTQAIQQQAQPQFYADLPSLDGLFQTIMSTRALNLEENTAKEQVRLKEIELEQNKQDNLERQKIEWGKLKEQIKDNDIKNSLQKAMDGLDYQLKLSQQRLIELQSEEKEHENKIYQRRDTTKNDDSTMQAAKELMRTGEEIRKEAEKKAKMKTKSSRNKKSTHTSGSF